MNVPSADAFETIKIFEGFSATVYRCPAGHPTVGYGHRLGASERFGQPLDEAQAEALLARDVARFSGWLDAAIAAPVTQSMFDALVSFVYNVGFGRFKHSTLRRLIEGRQYAAAADEFLRWNKARDPQTGRMVSLAGLTLRREVERRLFLQDGIPN